MITYCTFSTTFNKTSYETYEQSNNCNVHYLYLIISIFLIITEALYLKNAAPHPEIFRFPMNSSFHAYDHISLTYTNIWLSRAVQRIWTSTTICERASGGTQRETNEHIFANFICETDVPLRCVARNSELLQNYAHTGIHAIRKYFPLYFLKYTPHIHFR